MTVDPTRLAAETSTGDAPRSSATNTPTAAGTFSRPSRSTWARMAVFGLPYAAVFLVRAPIATFLPQSWGATGVNIVIDSVFLTLAASLFGHEFFSAFSYMRTHPGRKVASLFGLWLLIVVSSHVARLAVYGQNPEVTRNQHNVVDALNDGAAGGLFSIMVVLAVPLVEEVFFRHILIGSLDFYAPTWLVATASCLLFTAMHCHRWQEFFLYLPIGIILTLTYLGSGRNVAYSWLLHTLNNLIALIVLTNT